jgi:hypothetical protein
MVKPKDKHKMKVENPPEAKNEIAPVNLPWREYLSEFKVAIFWYLAILAIATCVFWLSPELTKAAIPPWFELKKSVERITLATRYIVPFVGLVAVLTFALVGFIVCFPRFKGLANAFPGALLFIARQAYNAGAVITLWFGGATALILGESLRTDAVLDWWRLAGLFVGGLAGKAITAICEVEMGRAYLEKRAMAEVLAKAKKG